MRYMIILIFTFLLSSLFASEFPSEHKSTFLKQLNDNGALTDGKSYYMGIDRFNLSKYTRYGKEGTYYPNGFSQHKLYLPAGLKYAGMSMSCKPNADFLIHMRFVGNNEVDVPVFDHASPANFSTTWNMKGTARKFIVNGKSFNFDTDVINAAGGGWLYYTVVEDDSNPQHDSYHGIVHPEMRTYLALQTNKGSEIDSWVGATTFLNKSGDPSGPKAGKMTIIDKRTASGTSTRTISTDLGTQRYADLKEYMDLYGGSGYVPPSSSSSSSSSSSYSSSSTSSSSFSSSYSSSSSSHSAGNEEQECIDKGGQWVDNEGFKAGCRYSSSSYSSSSSVSSSSSSSSSSYSSSSSHSTGSEQQECIDNGGQWVNNPGFKSGCKYSSSSHSSISSVSSSSSSSSSSVAASEPVLKSLTVSKFVSKSYPIHGYFIHYGVGNYEWVYVGVKKDFAAKLEGILPDKQFKWTLLDMDELGNITIDAQNETISFKAGEKADGIESILKSSSQKIEGFFVRYGEGKYEWAYVAANASFAKKLEGMAEDGELEWSLLDMSLFKEIKIDIGKEKITFVKCVDDCGDAGSSQSSEDSVSPGGGGTPGTSDDGTQVAPPSFGSPIK